MRSDPDFRSPHGDEPAVDAQVSGCDEVFREETLRRLTGARFVPVDGATRYRLKLCFRE